MKVNCYGHTSFSYAQNLSEEHRLRRSEDLGLRPDALRLMLALILACSVGCGSPHGDLEATAMLGHTAALSPAADQSCSTAGTWAVDVHLPVTWPQNLGLVGGQGEMVYRAKLTQDMSGRVELALCSLALPSYATRAFVGGEHYQLDVEPDSLADTGSVQSCHLEDTGKAGVRLLWALTLGANLEDPFSSSWPTQRDDMRTRATPATDRYPQEMLGACMVPRQDEGFSLPAINRTRTRRASHFFTALRHRFELLVQFQGCNRLVGRPGPPQSGWQDALQSTSLGCIIAGAEEQPSFCSDMELSLANTMAPKFAVADGGYATLVKIDPSCSCDAVRHLDF